jgi:hypothetical protein
MTVLLHMRAHCLGIRYSAVASRPVRTEHVMPDGSRAVTNERIFVAHASTARASLSALTAAMRATGVPPEGRYAALAMDFIVGRN